MNGQEQPKEAGEFEFVVVGGGTAGCLLANRLSANPANRVLLLEAGGRDNYIWFHIPVGYLFLIGNPRADWMFRTKPSPGLNNRSLLYPRGRVLGGCSAINGMIYMRGQAADYDQWAQMGLPAGRGPMCCPTSCATRTTTPARPICTGRVANGAWREMRLRWEILDAFRDAAAEAGIPKVPDFNRGDNFGSAYFQVNQKKGLRWSAARGFLDPAKGRPNLEIRTDSEAMRVEFDGKRATGIVYRRGGRVRDRERAANRAGRRCRADTKVADAFGIGSAAHLAEFGIETRLERPGVGANLQDHLQLRPVYKVSGVRTLNTDYANLLKRGWMGVEFALFRRGPLTMAPSQLGIFAKSDPRFATANVQFHVQPLSLNKFGEPLDPFAAFTASVCNLRPTSRGAVRLASPDPFARRRSTRIISPRKRIGRSRSIPCVSCAGSWGRRRCSATSRRNIDRDRHSRVTRISRARPARSARRSSIRSARRGWASRMTRWPWSMPASPLSVARG